MEDKGDLSLLLTSGDKLPLFRYQHVIKVPKSKHDFFSSKSFKRKQESFVSPVLKRQRTQNLQVPSPKATEKEVKDELMVDDDINSESYAVNTIPASQLENEFLSNGVVGYGELSNNNQGNTTGTYQTTLPTIGIDMQSKLQLLTQNQLINIITKISMQQKPVFETIGNYLKELNDTQSSGNTPTISNSGPVPPPPTIGKNFLTKSQSDLVTSNDFDWNLKFQQAIDLITNLHPNSNRNEQIKAYLELERLSTYFIYTVKTYARIIISEVYLPNSEKIIKPVSIGGIAGGAKYIVQRILFKFAIDHKELYSGDHIASKVAGHELKSLTQLVNCWEAGLRYPLMALVDYRGFRVIGMSLLPINGEVSLIHGSSDGAKTIRYHPLIAPKLKSISEKLNLAPHFMGNHSQYEMHLPVDLETHYGTDGEYYLLDFSRLFPPEAPSPLRKMDYLHKLLRPEFVKHYQIPLCSDAYSNFVKPNAKTYANDSHYNLRKQQETEVNENVLKATQYLIDRIIPSVANSLCEIPMGARHSVQLCNYLHSNGINLRYLGELRNQTLLHGDDYWASLLLIEMVSRVIKDEIRCMLREKMKEIKHPGEGAYKREIVARLNILFGNTRNSLLHWNTRVYPVLLEKYEIYSSNKQHSFGRSLKEEVSSIEIGRVNGRWLLLRRISEYLGIEFANKTWLANANTSEKLFSYRKPFEETDFSEMKDIVKSLDMIAHATGFVLKMKALLSGSTLDERKRLLFLAIESFQKALASNPGNASCLYNLADCLMLIGEYERAQKHYQRALSIDGKNTVALFKYACL